MNDYVHPVWIGPHRATIVSHDLGVKVTCLCGWSTNVASQPRAASAYQGHCTEIREAEKGAGS